MIEALRKRFMDATRARVGRKLHSCPNCGSGLENMELLWGRIHTRGRDGIQCKIHIRCWACNRMHTYRKPGADAVQVWLKLQQGRDFRARARMRVEELRLASKEFPGSITGQTHPAT